MSLTHKQKALLLYLDGYIKEHGACPSYEDMRDAMNLSSKSGINRLIMALEERGFIRRLPHRARAIEVIRLPGANALPTYGDSARDAYRQALTEIASGYSSPDAIALRVLERFP